MLWYAPSLPQTNNLTASLTLFIVCKQTPKNFFKNLNGRAEINLGKLECITAHNAKGRQ